jgi:acyl-CoA thioester hydrolase
MTAAPFVSSPMTVDPAWIDYNGHMNMAYYNVLFDRCADEAFETLGMGPAYARNRKLSAYTAEVQVRYLRELHVGDTVTVTLQHVAHDAKRLHAYQEIRHGDGWLSATAEVLWLHIDMTGPRVAPFPADVVEKIEAMAVAHAALPAPFGIGRPVGIGGKTA